MIKRIFTILITIFFFGGLIAAYSGPLYARECIDSGDGELYCIGDSCPTQNCDPPSKSNLCCTPSVASTNADCQSTWDYNYDYQCVIDSAQLGSYTCDWKWQFSQCAAVDHCSASTSVGHPYLNAGSCSSSGCAVGGRYKTCCSGNLIATNSCVAQQPSVIPNHGVCPSGSSPVLCGPEFGVPCGQQACGPTPTPTPITSPTPTPTPGPCPVGQCCIIESSCSTCFSNCTQHCLDTCNNVIIRSCGSCISPTPTPVCNPGQRQTLCSTSTCSL